MSQQNSGGARAAIGCAENADTMTVDIGTVRQRPDAGSEIIHLCDAELLVDGVENLASLSGRGAGVHPHQQEAVFRERVRLLKCFGRSVRSRAAINADQDRILFCRVEMGWNLHQAVQLGAAVSRRQREKLGGLEAQLVKGARVAL